MEAEAAGVAEGAGVAAAVPAAERARAVLDDPQAACRGELQERVHVGAEPEQVHGDDADGALGDERLDRCATSMLNVSRSTSQKTGVAPMYSTTLAVETQVKAGTMTSSPGLRPSAATAMCSAVVHELVATACGGAGVGREALLELLDERALHDPAALERQLDGAQLLGAEDDAW